MTSQRGHSYGTWHLGTFLLCRHLGTLLMSRDWCKRDRLPCINLISCGEIVLELAFLGLNRNFLTATELRRFLAAGLLAREQPDQDDCQNHGDDADDGASEFDA